MSISKFTTAALLLLSCAPFAVCGKPASEASVLKLMQVTQVQQQLAGAVEQVKTMMRAQMQQGLEKAAGKIDDPEAKAMLDELMDDVMEIVTSEMASPELLADMTMTYASVYSEEEVQAQIKFYSSPVGQKVVERGPELLKATMTMMQLRVPAMQARLATVLNEFQAKALELKAKKLREKSQPAPDSGSKPDADKKP